MQDKNKEFKPTSWAIDNKITIYVATFIICFAGIMTYNSLSKENFPEVVFPQIFVSTIYPGAAPPEIENLITKPIEKQVKSISGVNKVSSNSVQDFSNIIIEFETYVSIQDAKQEVRDAVDKAKRDLPTDLTTDPNVIEIDFSELPIMNINLSGNYDLKTIKRYAELIQDRIEALPEIRRVDIVGALDREIQINLDIYKSSLAGVSLDDIQQAVGGENVLIPGGQISVDGMKRSLSVSGEYKSAVEIGNTVVGSTRGGKILLKDIAQVIDSNKEKESYSRFDGKNVISLNVVKRSGENLIEASDKIINIIEEFKSSVLPEDLNLDITSDQSDRTRDTLKDLINTIIIGFILVTFILQFFMNSTNAIFVGMSVPLSSFITFLVFPSIGFTLNMMTLFSFLLALGIVVDDAIVVIENTHRIFDNGKVPIRKAAKIAAGEVFLPVFSGTMVVLAPFIPLAFWPGVIGKFMMYLPITLIIALLASLLVAYLINPIFAADFMKPVDPSVKEKTFSKGFIKLSIGFAVLALFAYIFSFGVGNFIVTLYLIYALNHFYLKRVTSKFQKIVWPNFQQGYKKMLTWCLLGWRPIKIFIALIFLFVLSIVFTMIRKPPVVFFPQGDPHFIFTYIRMPIGTDQRVTDSITQIVEARINEVVGKDNPIVESIIANVGIGASEDRFAGTNSQPHLGKVTVAFVKYSERMGHSSRDYLNKIRVATTGIVGAEISVAQEANGPPTDKPVNIEIVADNFELLVNTSTKLQTYLDSLQIPGIEELTSDFQSSKPEVQVKINREKANREGISTQQIGYALNGAVYGREVSKFRDDDDDYPIELRLREDQRNDLNVLMNFPIIFRDMASGGMVRQVPLSSVASFNYSNSYAGIRRIDQKRVITLSSNVLSGFNANQIVAQLTKLIKSFPTPDGVTVQMTGEQEQQAETSSFLGIAFTLAFMLIFMILVTQFNSVGKPLIILAEIIFSIIGVLIGFSLFKMEISIVMTGVGVMALAGLIVRNGILLVEFTDLLIEQGVELREAIAEASMIRMTPVLLTTMAATLGLIPLAVGFNIDFVSLFTELNPHIFFGGDSVVFWGPLSWTMIFGLVFGTMLTLIIVPVMYLLLAKANERVFKTKEAALPAL